MKSLVVILVFSLTIFSVSGQDALLATWEADYDIIKVDKLGQVYLVKGSRIEKYNKQGRLTDVYDRTDLGTISSVDVSDPFKPLIFFKDHATFLLCDSRLQVLNKTNLFDLGILQPADLCTSPSQGFWVMDMQDFRLKKFDTRYKVLHESEEISSFVAGGIITGSLAERNDRVYFQTLTGKILIFDRFGNIIKVEKDSIAPVFSWTERECYFIEENIIKKINISATLPEVTTLYIATLPIKMADKSAEFLLLYFENKIELREYKF